MSEPTAPARSGANLPAPVENRPQPPVIERICSLHRQRTVPLHATRVIYSHPTPSPSGSSAGEYPGSPTWIGSAPAARTASQLS